MSNYKYVITDGCSFVHGSGCRYCDAPTRDEKGKVIKKFLGIMKKCPHKFGALLADKLDAKYIDFSSRGKSNSEILNTIYKGLQKYKKISDQCLVIIGTTHFLRGEFMSVDANPHSYNPHLRLALRKHPVYSDREFKDFLLNHLDSDAIHESFQRQYNLTLNWLESHGFKYFIFNSFHKWDFGKNQINFECHVGDIVREYPNWLVSIQQDDRKSPSKPDLTLLKSYDGHPSVYSHQLLAEKIYDIIRRN
mgnify:CR=1 FL=1